MTKILIALENIGLGGMKRATTVVGNALAQQHNVVYYSFSDLPPFYTLSADLLVAKRPLTLANDAKPYVKYAEQIQDFLENIKLVCAQRSLKLNETSHPLPPSFVPSLT